MAGRKRCYVIGEYVPPNNQPMVNWEEQDMLHGLEGVETLLARDLNALLTQPWYQHEEDLENAANYRLVDQTLHMSYQDGGTEGREAGHGGCVETEGLLQSGGTTL